MAESIPSSSSRRFGRGTLLGWLMGVLCFGVFVFLIVQVILQFAMPTTVHRLQLVQDVALPTIVVPPKDSPPIHAVRFDHFDFQALDPQTHLLFIAHPGPSDVRLDQLVQEGIVPRGAQINGSVVVFNTKDNTIVRSLNLPNVHGLVAAQDLGRIYAAGSSRDVVYSIDERTMNATTIDIAPNCKTHQANQPTACENPDSLEYDPVNHKIFVSCPDGHNQVVINALTDKVLGTIDLSGDKTGDSVGHTRYDAVSQQIFVVVQPLPDPNNPNSPWPPAKLVRIDPVTDRISGSVPLPDTCQKAHGMGINPQQQVAFVACVDSRNVHLVDLHAMKAIGDAQHIQSVGIKPDIVAFDLKLHILYVASASSITVFDESRAASGTLTKLGDYTISNSSSHSIVVDEQTHNIYIPLTDIGGQPVLRIEQYNPNGTV